jgi:hypothetical protein
MAKVTEPVVKDLDALQGIVPGVIVESVRFTPDSYGGAACFKVSVGTDRSTMNVGWVKPGTKSGAWFYQTPWVGGPLGWSTKAVTILTALKRMWTAAGQVRIS